MPSGTGAAALRLRSRVAAMRCQVQLARLAALLNKYDPNQPRDELGRWTEGGAASGDGEGEAGDQFTDMILASRKRSASDRDCEAQYERDTFHCTMVGLASCHRQAAVRYAACLRGQPMPPLNY